MKKCSQTLTAIGILSTLSMFSCGGGGKSLTGPTSLPTGASASPSSGATSGGSGAIGSGFYKLPTLKDRETGSTWNIKGEAIDGPLKGKALSQIPSHNAMWFAWLAFWGNTEVYGSAQKGNGGEFRNTIQFPQDKILSGGPPPDGIPALTDPAVVSASQASWGDEEMVSGVVMGTEARAYPHNIGWWHEIVNDRVGGHPICYTFCPLTGTGLVFDGDGGERITLGVSGLLFNTNLIMYDRRDRKTLYPQMIYMSINGTPQDLRLLPVTETKWGLWKQLYPQTKVISAQTGYPRNYDVYPYGSYREDGDIFFPLAQDVKKNALIALFHPKETVLGLMGINGTPRAYPFKALGERAALNETLDGRDILVVWYREGLLAVPYSRTVDGRSLTFEIVSS